MNWAVSTAVQKEKCDLKKCNKECDRCSKLQFYPRVFTVPGACVLDTEDGFWMRPSEFVSPGFLLWCWVAGSSYGLGLWGLGASLRKVITWWWASASHAFFISYVFWYISPIFVQHIELFSSTKIYLRNKWKPKPHYLIRKADFWSLLLRS